MTPPDATVGTYYTTDITFWLPPSFADPGSGATVSFQQMTITGIAGLPFGIAMTPSEPSGVYYPQQSEYGCAQLCGTPLGAGSFPITINILASVMIGGISIDIPQQFSIVLNVLPGSSSNNGFTFSPTTGCGSVTATFEALIDADPQPTTWLWDFGNGNTSILDIPPPQTYTGPGSYVITLGTTIGGYVLNSVSVTGVNGNWCGDVEEPNLPLVGCTGSPDLYFVLTDASGGTVTSSTFDNTTTATWNGLGLVLNSAPYSIAFYDEDVISQNDLLGTYNIPANGDGTYFINVAGGTTGSLSIDLVDLQFFLDQDTLVVFPVPDHMLTENPTNGELCATNDSLASYVWTLDGDTVQGATGPCYMPTGEGLWAVIGTNGFGCSSTSNSIVVCPLITIVREGNVLSVPAGYQDYSWTFNGTAIGADQPFLVTQEDGMYAVTMSGPNGCEMTAEYELNTVGLEDVTGLGDGLAIHPNPSGGPFTVEAKGLPLGSARILVHDAGGRVVAVRPVAIIGGTLRYAMTLDLAPGAYLVEVRSGERSLVGRLLME